MVNVLCILEGRVPIQEYVVGLTIVYPGYWSKDCPELAASSEDLDVDG